MVKNSGADYMRSSLYANISESPQAQGIPFPELESKPPADATLIPVTPHHQLHIVPGDLQTTIEKRRTARAYADQPLTFDELSYLLWCTAGVQRVVPGKSSLRTVPSAGGKHSIDTYLMVHNVEGLKPGLYRYYALKSALVCLSEDDQIHEKLMDATRGQKQVLESAVTFIWVGILERIFWRYVERGYRYIHLDAGHICQNLYLTAEQIGCAVCAIAAFDDEKVNAVVGVNGENQFAIYLASLGKRKQH